MVILKRPKLIRKKAIVNSVSSMCYHIIGLIPNDKNKDNGKKGNKNKKAKVESSNQASTSVSRI